MCVFIKKQLQSSKQTQSESNTIENISPPPHFQYMHVCIYIYISCIKSNQIKRGRSLNMFIRVSFGSGSVAALWLTASAKTIKTYIHTYIPHIAYIRVQQRNVISFFFLFILFFTVVLITVCFYCYCYCSG